MTTTHTHTSNKDYYAQITAVDIGQVARQILAGRITRDEGKTLLCDCPNHASQSHLSLQISISAQKWFCFACQIGGDVLQLVEFVNHGTVTKGHTGEMPASHRAARDYLAQIAGLPPLSKYGLSNEQIQQIEKERSFETAVRGALTEICKFYHAKLTESPGVIDWTKSQWGIFPSIDDLLIGYADNVGLLPHLYSAGYDDSILIATGAFIEDHQGRLQPFFVNRIIFPYWQQGSVVFMIGRKTPFTPDKPWEAGKYKKLQVHNEHDRKFIAPFVSNSYLYNEDVLLSHPSRLIITEGVTDCIALMQAGFPVISPVTVQFSEKDWGRIIPKLKSVQTVYICQDNEVSEVGLKGAYRTYSRLKNKGIKTMIVTLPLGEKQLSARLELIEANAKNGTAEEVPAGEKDMLKQSAKMDVAEYFFNGAHTPEDFELLLLDAKTPIDFGIDEIAEMTHLPEENEKDAEKKEEKIQTALLPLLEEVATLPAIERDAYYTKIMGKVNNGKNRLNKTALKEQIREIRATKKQEQKHEKQTAFLQVARVSSFPAGSCKAAIETAICEAKKREAEGAYSPLTSPAVEGAQACFDWFCSNGAKFYTLRSGEPFLYYNGEIYYPDSPERTRRRAYHAKMQQLTGMITTSRFGATFFESFANLCSGHGIRRSEITWGWTDTAGFRVFFNLNNDENEIIRITPDGITLLTNGGNDENIILSHSDKLQPIIYQPDADPDEAESLIDELITRNLTCSAEEGLLIRLWFSTFLLIDYTQTKTIMRFEGAQQSGKSTASEFISYLIYGKDWKKTSTNASNYTDASMNPFLFLDNIETKNMTPDLLQFFITAATGVVKEKRQAGTDSGIVTERVHGLINTTGIEPLGAGMNELLSRTITCVFDSNRSKPGFLKQRIFDSIKLHRDKILSGIFKRTAQVLNAIRQGQMERALLHIESVLPKHQKSRNNEYLAIMLLYLVAGKGKDEATTLSDQFFSAINRINREADDTSIDTNDIASILQIYFDAYAQAQRADDDPKYYSRDSSVRRLLENYGIEVKCGIIENIKANTLFGGLKRFSRDRNIRFNYVSVKQFASRLKNDAEVIQKSGIKITSEKGYGNFTYYTIRLFCEDVICNHITIDDSIDLTVFDG